MKWIGAAFTIICVAMLTFGIYMVIKSGDDFSNKCHLHAGQVLDVGRGNYLCLTTDGRIMFSE